MSGLLDDIEAGLHNMSLEVVALRRELGTIESAIARAESQDPTTARPWWRPGGYLYLIHPQVNKQPRLREYVGRDPDAIRAALIRVHVGRVLDGLVARRESVEARARRLHDSVKYTSRGIW